MIDKILVNANIFSMKQAIISSFANTTRLKLLICLKSGSKNVTELIANCGLSQSAVSQHLEKLRVAGLVTGVRDGREIVYRLRSQKSGELAKSLLNFAKEVDKK